MNTFEWILFDIGGVLVELAGTPKILKWMNWRVDKDEMIKMWVKSNSVRAYETGKISTSDFADNIVKELDLSVTPDEFIKEFTYFPKNFYNGVEELLQELSKQYSIASLSNTNEIHWDKLCKEDNFDKLIQNNFLSFQIGYMKPDKEIYSKVLESINCEADKIIFFDDSLVNVETARAAGMRSEQTIGFDELISQISKLKIL